MENWDNTCPICYEDMGEFPFTDRCGHRFDQDCINKCANSRPIFRCPISRLEITNNPITEIIEEIMAKKRKAKTEDFHAAVPSISTTILDRIKWNDLLGAALIAIFEKDAVSRNILCSRLLTNQDICIPKTSDANLVRLLLEPIEDVDKILINSQRLLEYAVENGLSDIVSIILTKIDLANCTYRWDKLATLALENGHFHIFDMLGI